MMSQFMATVSLLVLAGCACEPSLTLLGERVEPGGDPNAVVDTIDLPNLPAVSLSAERGKIGIGIYQAHTGQPYVELGDRDSDGVFDMLTYRSLSATGEIIVEVEDYGMDGQADFRWNEREASVYHKGAWHAVLDFGSGQSFVEIGGRSVPLNDLLRELGRDAF